MKKHVFSLRLKGLAKSFRQEVPDLLEREANPDAMDCWAHKHIHVFWMSAIPHSRYISRYDLQTLRPGLHIRETEAG